MVKKQTREEPPQVETNEQMKKAVQAAIQAELERFFTQMDEYMWVELQDSPTFTIHHYYWKVNTDPAILVKVFHCDWRNTEVL